MWICARHAVAVAVAAVFGRAIAAEVPAIQVTGDVSPPGITTLNNNIAGQLVIGNTAAGTMSVLNGATFSSSSSFIQGLDAGASGTMTVGGAGASATAATFIDVGRSGTGVLNVLAGGTVSAAGGGTSSGNISLGVFATGSGTVNVNGGALKAGTANAAPDLRVGVRSTSAALNITNGGYVSVGHASSGVGLDTGSLLQIGGTGGVDQAGRGDVLVSGAGSLLELLGENTALNVGRQGSVGTSTLTIENGGRVNAGRFLGVGRSLLDATSGDPVPGTGATGLVIVDGTDSKLVLSGIATTGPNANVGPSAQIGRDHGTGTLTVRNGGLMQFDGRGATSSASGGAGGITVGLHAGSSGTVNIESGGRIELLSDSNADNLGFTVARLGTGSFNMSGGAQFLMRNTGTGGVGMPFGGNSSTATGGTFSGSISGSGTTFVLEGMDASLTVGSRSGSSGTVTFEDGAMAAPGHRIIVASSAGSSATLNIRGAGTVIDIKAVLGDENGAGITAGRSGNGIVNISDGAVVNVDGAANALRHATNVGGSGTDGGGAGVLNITGAATRYNVTGASTSLIIGRDDSGAKPSTGTMTIADGAQMSFPSTGAAGSVAYSPNSTGTLHVVGAGSRLDMGSFLGVGARFDSGEEEVVAGGTGLLNVANGGVVKAATIHVGAHGTVTGDGTLDGNVVNEGAINPGNSPGILTITGDLELVPGGVLTMEVAGALPGQYDVIAVGGSFIADGTLRIVNTGGYVPSVGDTLNLITYAAKSGAFESVVFEGFGSANLAGRFGGGAFQVLAVPEPHEWALMLAGLALVCTAARRRAARFKPV